MKAVWISFAAGVAALVAVAGDLKVTVSGGGMSGTFVVTTNESSVGKLNWSGEPGSGGQYEITAQIVSNSVVLKEVTMACHRGIITDVTAKTIVPTNKVPWTGTISQTTVTVFRVEQTSKNNPANAPDSGL